MFERNDLGRDVAEDRAGPSGLQEDVDAETGDVTHLKGKIAFVVLFKDLTMVVAHHVIDQGVDLFFGQCGVLQLLQVSMDAHHGRFAGTQMAIRTDRIWPICRASIGAQQADAV